MVTGLESAMVSEQDCQTSVNSLRTAAMCHLKETSATKQGLAISRFESGYWH